MARNVSIPKRVLEALNHSNAIAYQSRWYVSIPKRVLEALNPTDPADTNADDWLVSIPKRVLEALNRKSQLCFGSKINGFNP